MRGFESIVVVDRPIEEVFAVLANLENDVKWRREWIDAKKTSEGPLGVGASFRLVGKFLGHRSEVDYETIEYEPNRGAAWRAASGPLPLTFWRTFDRTEDGTRVTMRYEGELRGLLRLVGPLVVGMGKRQLEGDLPKLKELIEARAS